jgi:uncharacterized membrane protein
MERVGLAASKIAQGNLWLYNIFVILISFLFSLFIFVISASAVLFALIIMTYIAKEMMAFDFEESRRSVFTICMMSLAIVTLIFNLLIISKNLKFSKTKQ